MDKKNVYDRVANLCEERGISQRQLQRELDIAIGTITKWKTSTPKPETLQKVAGYFNVTTDYLIGKTPYMNQDHMIKCLDEQYANVDNKPDVMLPDGTILEFKGMNNSVTLHTTCGNVEYVYIDPETRKIAEYIQTNEKMKELLSHMMDMDSEQLDTIYNMIMMIK